MKKSIIFGLVLLAVGALLFSLGFFGSGKNLSAVNGNLGPIAIRAGFGGSRDGAADSGNYQEYRKSYDAAGLRRIVLDEDNASVAVTLSPDDKIRLIWQESADDPMEITDDGGTLSVKRKSRFGIFLFWGFWGEDLHTELQIPEGMTAELNVKSDNGAITADGLTLEGGAEFSSSNGAVTAEGLTLYGDAKFSSSNGNIEAKNLSVKRLTLDNSNSAVTAEGVSCTEAVLENSNGKIEATDFACDTLKAENSNGRVTLTNVAAEATLYAETSNGALTVDNISAGQAIELRAGNGSVRGTLAGSSDDYAIQSKTGNGSSNLPGDWGKGSIRLTVRTDNGSIDLNFAED